MINEVFDILVERADFFIDLTIEHLTISMIAILIASILGLFLGIFISEYKKSSKVVLTLVNFIYTIPSISLLGFLIPFSGIGNTTAIIALSVYALLPMVRNTHTGMTNINPSIIEAARGMGSTDFQILYKIKLPLAFPIIMSGLRSMAVMTIALAGIASFIGAGGLGVAIYRGITTNNAALTIAGSLLIAILAFAVDTLLGTIEKLTSRKASSKQKKVTLVVSLAICIAFVGSVVFASTGKDTIHIATKPMSEQHVLGEMMKLLIEQDTDLEVKLTQGVGGGTANIQPAMVKGEFDLYPEYTGTGWNDVLKENNIYHEDLFPKLQEQYEKQFDFTWISDYGFNNTYGIAVHKDIAELYDLKTYSDLAKISDQLTFGAEYDFFEREDGYDALKQTYGYNFMKTVDLDIGLKYQAIQNKQVDVINIFTTDGQLHSSDVVVLEDDQELYPSYRCWNVIRLGTLNKHPELKSVLSKFDNLINDEEMTNMNYLVEIKGQEPKQVARDYLNEKGLLK